MIITLPFRRMTLHFSHIGLTEGLTFIVVHPPVSAVAAKVAAKAAPAAAVGIAAAVLSRLCVYLRYVMRPRVRS